jgi:hypothetical protein
MISSLAGDPCVAAAQHVRGLSLIARMPVVASSGPRRGERVLGTENGQALTTTLVDGYHVECQRYDHAYYGSDPRG